MIINNTKSSKLCFSIINAMAISIHQGKSAILCHNEKTTKRIYDMAIAIIINNHYRGKIYIDDIEGSEFKFLVFEVGRMDCYGNNKK